MAGGTPDDKPAPQIWVKVVEAHAAKTWIGLILAIAGGISLVAVAVGAVTNTIMNPDVTDLSANFMTLLGTTLGTLFGGLVGFISGQAVGKKNGNGDAIHEGDMTLHVDPPPDIRLDVDNPTDPPAPTAK